MTKATRQPNEPVKTHGELPPREQTREDTKPPRPARMGFGDLRPNEM
jgi:hypothetical protein